MELRYKVFKELIHRMSYDGTFALHEKSQFWSKKNLCNPEDVSMCSNKKFYFDCIECGHEIFMPLNHIARGSWCKYCANNLCDDVGCDYCLNKSFASHPMASMWSPLNDIEARDVRKGSDKKFYFDCTDCGHTFESALYSLKTDKSCIYCANQRVCGDKECTHCFNKTIASLEIVNRWSDKNKEKPWEVLKYSNRNFIFKCTVCDHEYNTTPSHVVGRGGSCMYCSNQKLCTDNACVKCFKNSFASSPKVNCWSTKNKLKPRDVFQGSAMRALFNCEVCACEFDSILYNVKTGYWCPFCKNKTEGILSRYLLTKSPNWKRQKAYSWCMNEENKVKLPFDFVNEELRLIIELDGIQHFKQVSNWTAPEDNMKRDIYKMNCAINNGYSVIRLLQDDVWNYKYDWKSELNIYFVKRETPETIFLEKGNQYIKYKECLLKA